MTTTSDMTVHYSSQREDWATPPDLFATLHGEFGFTLDAAASAENAKVDRYLTIADDALTCSWRIATDDPEHTDVVWLNPPYGRTIGRWMEKAIREADDGATVVTLVPARTDSLWFQHLARRAQEIRLLAGRVTFVGASEPAPFPNAVAILRPEPSWATNHQPAFAMPHRHDPATPWTRMWTID